MILHGYFRSSAAWRVRIALALKGLRAEDVFHHLRKGEQRSTEYLDETHPEPPLLPVDPVMRARVRAVAQAVACDIHPVQNLKVLKRLRELGQDESQVQAWAAWVIKDGLDAVERMLAGTPGPFAFGDRPTLADIVIAPQLANARRFGVEVRWPRLQAIEAACMELEAFSATAPAMQPDAE